MSAPPLSTTALAHELADLGRAHGWELHALSPINEHPRPWLRLPGTRSDAPRLYVSAGIHGDEPAGPLAARELAGRPESFHGLEVFLFPLLNPEGLTANARGNRFGIDCNRDYQNPQSEEVRGHLDVLRTLPRFDAALCLHEDWEAKGVYLYELNDGRAPELGRPLLDAMRRHLPVETASEIDGFPADRGIISKHADDIYERPDWPEAFYLTKHHSPLCCTLETPSSLALAPRVAAHVSAVRTAARALADLPPPAA